MYLGTENHIFETIHCLFQITCHGNSLGRACHPPTINDEGLDPPAIPASSYILSPHFVCPTIKIAKLTVQLLRLRH